MNFNTFQELLSIITSLIDIIDIIKIARTFFIKIKKYIKKILYKQITINFYQYIEDIQFLTTNW
jgi:magnesium-transporting ATPase (P-type)